VNCPHCHKEAKETRSFLLGDSVGVYCNDCGWNTEKAAKNLRIDIWVMWTLSAVGVLLIAAAWMKESWGLRMALGIAIAFVALPFGSGLITRHRLSKIRVGHVSAPEAIFHGMVTTAATRADALQPRDVSLATRPRVTRLTKRGYVYSLGMALATLFVLWILSFGLRGMVGPSSADKTKSMLIVLLWSVFFWSCVSFYRNRIRERRLFMNGELALGVVMTQSNTQFGSRIVYSYRDANGNVFQSRATDFSKKLYEEMTVHVFYNPLNSRESAALEGSLYQVL
jgi:hypothetical protein